MFTVDLELHANGKKHDLIIKDKYGIVLQFVIKGTPYYAIFKRKERDTWIAFGGSEDYGVELFNISKKSLYNARGHITQYNKYLNVLPSPTGEYLMLLHENYEMELYRFGALLDSVVFVDKTPIPKFKDASMKCVEWISNGRLIYRSEMYYIIFDASKETTEWNGVTLFNLLERSMKNDIWKE